MITLGLAPRQILLLAFGKHWLAVDKPAGMSVHNEPGRDLCSLVAACIQTQSELRGQVEMEPGFGVHPVHRLDRETSGVLMLAVSREVFRFFSNQFEARQLKKLYAAVLHGRLESLDGTDSWGMWRWPLAKTAGGRQHPEGSGERRESLTRYRVQNHSAHYTLVEIELLSGRKHQIRRHAKLAGHPVVGDGRYGSTRAINYLRRNHGFDRLALHARALTLELPGGEGLKTITTTPAIPAQMQELFEQDLTANES